MVDNCPECQTPLITRTIKKELAFGSIDYPVALICPKCSWTKDLTGAGNIVAKPMEKPVHVKPSKQEKEKPKEVGSEPSYNFNRIIMIALVLIVIGAVVMAFYTTSPEKTPVIPLATPTPSITQTPAATLVITSTPVATTSITTPTVRSIQLDYFRIFRNNAANINSGDKVLWENVGTDPISLMSDDIPDFGVRLLDNGKRTSYTFTKSGTYTFYLKGKKSVNGTITVEP